MEVKIRKISNSQGVLIPKQILAQLGLEGSADLQVRDGVIEIRALRRIPRKDWADDARRLAAGADWPVWPELGNLQSGSEHLASQTSALGRKRKSRKITVSAALWNQMSDRTFPGGSKSRVNAAGDAIRRGLETSEDLEVIEEWRSAHTAVINTFQALLRNRAKTLGAEVVQRLKRKATIFDKLRRHAGMDLARMDDVAGCRVIFRDMASLRAFRQSLHAARFAHRLRNDPDKYNYFKHPKPDGYRGIHDIYAYEVSSEEGRHLKGLNLELQYRTLTQHTRSTTVEILSHVTGHEPKYHPR